MDDTDLRARISALCGHYLVNEAPARVLVRHLLDALDAPAPEPVGAAADDDDPWHHLPTDDSGGKDAMPEGYLARVADRLAGRCCERAAAAERERCARACDERAQRLEAELNRGIVAGWTRAETDAIHTRATQARSDAAAIRALRAVDPPKEH